MKGLLEGPGGEKSSLRLCVVISTITGCLAVASGLVALFFRIPDAAVAMTVGAGMSGVGEIAKAMQAKAGR